MRAKIIATLFVCLAALVAVTLTLATGAGREYQATATESLKAGGQAVRIAHLVNEYSLATAAELAVSVNEVAAGFACPKTDAELAAANAEQTPMLNPATGQPMRNDAGLMLDTSGQPILPVLPGSRCASIQRVAVMNALETWTNGHVQRLQQADAVDVASRGPGFTLAMAPDLVIAANADGEVIARIGRDMRDWHGPGKPNMSAFLPVQQAELLAQTGVPSLQTGTIIWREHDSAPAKLAVVGVAPVMRMINGTNTFLGTVIVGNFVTDDVATDTASTASRVDVFYWYMQGSTLALAARDTTMPSGLDNELLGASLSPANGAAVSLDVAVGADPGSVFSAALSNGDFVVQPIVLARTEGVPTVGMVAISSLSASTGPLSQLFSLLPGVAIMLFLVGAVVIIASLRQYLAPLGDIGKGVLEVIAGNKDYMWPVDDKSDFSDISHSLNIMSARLQGKRDPDAEEGDGSEAWATPGAAGEPPRKSLGALGLRKRTTETGEDSPTNANGGTPE
jgi:hypothetical protein